MSARSLSSHIILHQTLQCHEDIPQDACNPSNHKLSIKNANTLDDVKTMFTYVQEETDKEHAHCYRTFNTLEGYTKSDNHEKLSELALKILVSYKKHT